MKNDRIFNDYNAFILNSPVFNDFKKEFNYNYKFDKFEHNKKDPIIDDQLGFNGANAINYYYDLSYANNFIKANQICDDYTVSVRIPTKNVWSIYGCEANKIFSITQTLIHFLLKANCCLQAIKQKTKISGF